MHGPIMTLKPRKIYSLSDTFVTLFNREDQQDRNPSSPNINNNQIPKNILNSEFQLLFHPNTNLVEKSYNEKNQKIETPSCFYNLAARRNSSDSKNWLEPSPKLVLKKGNEHSDDITTTDEDSSIFLLESVQKKKTRFYKWSSKVKREENKLLRRLFRHFGRSSGSGPQFGNNALNINGDYDKSDKASQKLKLTNPNPSVVNNNSTTITTITTTTTTTTTTEPVGIPPTRRLLIRSFSENEPWFHGKNAEDIDEAFIQNGVISTSLPAPDFFLNKNNILKDLPSEESLPETIVENPGVQIIVSEADNIMDDLDRPEAGQSGAIDTPDKVRAHHDDDTSSSYSTAEDESDLEPMSPMSRYATPRASRISLRHYSRASSQEFHSAMDLKADSDIEDNDVTEGDLTASLNSVATRIIEDIQKESIKENNLSVSVSSDESRPLRRKSKIEVLLTENQPIGHKQLQAVFDCFKEEDISRSDCDTLLESLGVAQKREDFQWALHQLGGFNALLVLYARVVEICSDDGVQSKSLSLVLNQLKDHYRLTDGNPQRQYHLIRFVLNSEKSSFGFKTFIHLMNFCLSASGLKLFDYALLDTCLLSSWKFLTRVRCKESDAPTGPKSLLECLLTIMLDLLEERNIHRDYNIALLKANRFSETLLAICYHAIVDTSTSLNLMDGLRIAALVKSIMEELMAPPDAYVAVTLIKYGLCPLLPGELPPSPRTEDAFFMFHKASTASAHHSNLKNIKEAEEANEGDRIGRADQKENSDGGESDRESVREFQQNSDVPELIGVQNDAFVRFQNARQDLSRRSSFGSTQSFNAPNRSFDISNRNYDTPNQSFDASTKSFDSTDRSPDTLARSKISSHRSFSSNQNAVQESYYDNDFSGRNSPNGSLRFSEAFQESLLEGIMSILHNTLSILPDNAYYSVLSKHMNAHIFVAFCSHPNSTLKNLALQLLGLYLSRAKNPIMPEFIRNKGFYLTSLYIQNDPDTVKNVLKIRSDFGSPAFPLVLALLYSNPVVQSVYEWAEKHESSVIPALLQYGLLPTIFNIQSSSNAPIQRPLQKLLSLVTRFCAVHPRDEPWRTLLVPALESGYGNSALVPRIVMESIEYLRRYKDKNLKKPDSSNRLMWLLERSSATRLGHHFDEWLLRLYTIHIMEMDDDEEKENWIYFVKRNKKKLINLMGIFLCRLFAVNRDNLDSKHYTIRVLLTYCPNLHNWLPKVIKSDERIERCFTAFVRVFLNHAEQKCMKLDSHLRTPSFHSLISDNGNLTLTLQMAGLRANSRNNNSDENFETESDPGMVQMSDSALRAKFENVLVDAGVMSPTSNFSMFSSNFRDFKVLMETPTSGVSALEMRQCLAMVEKLRTPYLLGMKHLTNGSKETSANAAYFQGVYADVNKYAMEMLVTVGRARLQQQIEVAKRICIQDEDVNTVKQWVNVYEQMIHPKAPWHFPECYPSFRALDQSEGPGRVRTRLKREHLKIHNRFVTPKHRKSLQPHTPLDYLFLSHTADVLRHPLILNEIQYMRFCSRIIPGEELQGEIILTQEHLTFIAENAHHQSENVEVRKTAIKYLMKRRYTLEDRAVEIFLECRSFLFVFKEKKDREEFVNLLGLKQTGTNGQIQFHSVNSTLMETSLTSMTSQWLKGQLSNFEYLMYLNTSAGRTYCDLMQYPVFPFVLSKYDCATLDLSAPQSYRDLKKPMAIQDSSKEDHFISTYNYLKRECESAPFHYGSHYSNSGIILHFLVRLPPYTQHFLKYQDGSFDIPDRSFHSIETTWRLASKESNTDFKEAIPEFFYLPEFLLNLQHFDLGVRQSGHRVDDVVLPPWAKGNARLFTLVNRQALESNHVRKFLCDWIDLIFGYKQTGKAALQAVNVFHPSTYEGFEVDGSGDELLIRARKAMVSTYGQTPKQLFTFPHPRPSIIKNEKCDMEVLDTVWGIRWGNYLGSPACPDLEVIHTREYTESVNLFETNSRIVFWPDNTVILGDNVVGYWNPSSIRIKTKVVYNSIGDDITVCRGTTNSVWVGHQSGRISVLKLSPDSESVLERTDLVGHYKPIRKIDVNQEFSLAISCAGENYAIMWDINKYPKIALINSIECPEAIDDIHSSRSTGDIVVLNKEYNRVTLVTINGHVVGSIEPDEQAESVCLSSLDPGRNVNVIAVGCDYGIIRFYSTWDLKFLNQLKVLPLASLAIKCIRYSRDGRRLYCMSETEEGAVTVALQLSNEFKNH